MPSNLVQILKKPIVVLLIGLGLSALLFVFKAKPDKVPPQERAWPIESVEVTPTELSPEILLHGRVESQQTTTLRGPLTAYVISTPVLEGDYVEKGQSLIDLDPIDAKLLLQQRIAQVEVAQAELLVEQNKNIADVASLELETELVDLVESSVQREQKLSKKNLASQSRVDEVELAAVREKLSRTARELSIKNHQARLSQLEANLASAVAERDLAQLNLERTKITAPFSGIINQLSVAIGDRVSTNDPIIEMYATDVLEVRAQLTTQRLAPILTALEQQVALTGTILDNAQLSATLDRIAGEIELDEGGVDALFTVQGDKRSLRLGQAVKIKLQLPEQDNVIAIPSTAVFENQSEHFIYQVISDNGEFRLKTQTVKLVGVQFIANQTYFVVQTTDDQPFQVMTTRLPLARDGLKVEVRG